MHESGRHGKMFFCVVLFSYIIVKYMVWLHRWEQMQMILRFFMVSKKKKTTELNSCDGTVHVLKGSQGWMRVTAHKKNK